MDLKNDLKHLETENQNLELMVKIRWFSNHKFVSHPTVAHVAGENNKGSYSLMCWRETTDDVRSRCLICRFLVNERNQVIFWMFVRDSCRVQLGCSMLSDTWETNSLVFLLFNALQLRSRF